MDTDMCAATHPSAGSLCVLDDGHDSHTDPDGNTWTTVPLAPHDPLLPLVRQRTVFAMHAVRRFHNGQPQPGDVELMAAAVPDLPILIQRCDGLQRLLRDAHTEIAELRARALADADIAATARPAEVGHG